MTASLRLLNRSQFEHALDAPLDGLHTIRVGYEGGDLMLEAVDVGGGPLPRVTKTMPYIEELHSRAVVALGPDLGASEFYFQADDASRDSASVSWQKQIGWTTVNLVPDLYYFLSKGYHSFQPLLPAWRSRRDAILWRGNTTGNPHGITRENLDELPRYKVLRALRETRAKVDVGFTSVVQAIPSQQTAIEERLRREELMLPYLQPEQLGASRFLLNVDGNASSWNFVQRLRSGACLLIVESPWIQWYHKDLLAGEHYVSIRNDLSNLEEQVEWCLSNPAAVEDIAWRAFRLGLSFDFDEQLTAAALKVFS